MDRTSVLTISALCLGLGFCLSSPVPSGIEVAKCVADHDCGDRYYCYQRSNRCVKCTNCTLYFREFSTNLRCSKAPLECGPCLERYEEEPFEGGGVRDVCVLKRNPSEENLKQEIMNSTMDIWWWVGAGFLCSVSVVSVVSILFNSAMILRRRSVRMPDLSDEPLMQPPPNGSCPNVNIPPVPTAPPPYFQGVRPREGYLNTQSPQTSAGNYMEDNFLFNIECKEENALNQATKFREAYSDDTDESLPERPQPEPVNIHNDETMESTWTPFSGSERIVPGGDGEQNLDHRRFRRAFSLGANDTRCSRCSVHCPRPCPDHGPEPKRLCIRQSAMTDLSTSNESEEDCESQTTQDCFEGEEQNHSPRETAEDDED